MEYATGELRPRNVGELFDAAVAVYRRGPGTLVRLSVALLAPFGLLQFLIVLSLVPDTGEQVNAAAVWAGVVSLTVLLLATTSALAALSTHAVLQRVVSDRAVTARESAAAALRRPGWIVLAFVIALLTSAGYALCVLPGLALWLTWSLAGPVYVTERTGIGTALRRSRTLLRGRWWAGALIYLGALLPWTGAVYLIAILGLVLAAIANAGPVAVALVVSLVTVGALVVLAPVLATTSVLLYIDGRVRHEAFDITFALAQRRTTGRAPALARTVERTEPPSGRWGAPPA